MVSNKISVRPLGPELAEVAKNELNETPTRLEEGIVCLKEWIERQPHLRARTDDQFLAAFLRGCKHSVENAKKKLDLHYSLRSTAPDISALKHNNPKFIDYVKTGLGLILPKRASPTSPRIVMIRVSQYDAKKFVPLDFTSVALVFQQISYLEDDPLMVCGATVILDIKGMTKEMLFQINPTILKKIMVASQEASPIRLRNIHVFGMPAFAESLNFFGNMLVSEKNWKKVVFYKGGPEQILEVFGKDILPAEYGGHAGTAQDIIDGLLKQLEDYGPWLEEDRKYGTDESKRPGKPKTSESEFGVEGSFRKLEID